MRLFLSRLFVRRLAFQLVGSFIATALLAGAVVGTLVIREAYAALRDHVLDANLAAANLAAAHTASYVAAVQSSAQALAARPNVVADIERDDFATLSRELEHWQSYNPHADTVTFFDLHYVNRAIGSSDKSMVGQSYMTTIAWREDMHASGKPAIGPAVNSRVTGRPIVPYAIPIVDSQGVLRGDITVGISLTALSDTLTSIHIAPSARPGLTDLERQIILIHADPSRVLTSASGRNEAQNRLTNGERGVLENVSSSGQRTLAAFAPVPGLRWGVLIQEPSDEAFAPVNAMIAKVLGLVAAALLMAVVVGLILASRIVRPISRLRSAATAMARGDLSVRTGIQRRDEIGDLGGAFDAMANKLQATVHQLQYAIDGLQDSEQRKGAILAAAMDAVISIDTAGRVTEFNPAAEAMFGYTRTEALGHELGDLLVPSNLRTAHRLGIEHAHSIGSSLGGQRIETVARRADGSEFPVELTITAFRLGDQPAYTGFLRDITERKRSEQILREGEERLRKQYQGIPVPTYTWQRSTDSDAFVLVAYNRAAEEITRGEIAGLIGHTADVVYADVSSIQRDLARCFSEQTTLSNEISYSVTRADEARDFVATYVYLAPDLVMVHTEDVTERKRAETALAHQALHDSLTGLPNRVLLGDRLEQAILVAEREDRELALLVLDLDRFKEVNDTLGHHAGDRLLQEVGRRLRGALRASDTVARLGGDEFAVVLPGSTDAPGAAAKLLHALESPFVLEGHTLALGGSIGIAQYPAHGVTVESLLRSADVAMYAAKRGRSGHAVYAPEQDQHSIDHLALLAELREALTHEDELVLHFQPKWNLQRGEIAGVEALVRWQHPRRGLLAPDLFIELAEQTGLMRPLTRWVLRAALRQVHAWSLTGRRVPVAVNLSPSSLQDERLADEIANLLAEIDVAPEWLEVEITEDAYMSQPELAAATLTRLREMGVRVAIDDFGTGYASLVYLQKLPVDALKIDRSFVRTMGSDQSHSTIVRSLIDLGHNLGLQVVAEGVEDEPTRDRLAVLGCDHAQGYALGRPQPAADLARSLWDSQIQQRAA